ncbi:MAG: substrate-binding domain-containing protein, partial [Candidatus Hydrothermarchaeaceae archaeon]
MPKPLYLLLLIALAGCLQEPVEPLSPTGGLTLATTTSVYDSGLLQALIPPFEEKCGCRVKVIAQGTGAALKKAELGGADAVIVHAPEAEKKFVADGFGVNRRAIMHNDFVIIGPREDPAGIRGVSDASETLKRIYDTKATFYSRGDDSGTHKKELALWRKQGVTPQGSWYRSTGVGMGATIIIADQGDGYTISDRSTYLSMESVNLVILSEGDPFLLNPYSVI